MRGPHSGPYGSFEYEPCESMSRQQTARERRSRANWEYVPRESMIMPEINFEDEPRETNDTNLPPEN